MRNFIISKKKIDNVEKFVTFNKDSDTFYSNYYLNDSKIVIEIPLLKNKKSQPEIKIERFSLANRIYLTPL